jgi:hypothetical protein
VYIKALNVTNTYDVFLGSGWTNWSRVLVKTDGTPVVIAGIPLNRHFLTHIGNAIATIFYSDLRRKRVK